MAKKTVLAVDIGAESGRVLAVGYDGERLHTEDVHRFPNPSYVVRGTRYWDFLQLWGNIQTGIERGKLHQPASLGIDTWAVDFALLDKKGNLLSNIVHYRDARTDGMMDRVFSRLPRREVFAQTGIQFMQLNTLYQLMSLVEAGSPLLEIADTFLTAPDLLNFWLTGERVCEFTNATTTQLYNPLKDDWADDLMACLDIPRRIFPAVVAPGTRLGSYDEIEVIAPACHDTGSAVAGVPAHTEHYAYLSSGTWSLLGLEISRPIVNDAAFDANVTNEGGVYGTYRFLKNVMGLWLLQQCRATWAAEGQTYDYGTLSEMAERAPAFASFIDPDDAVFLPPGDHPTHIRAFCSRTGQPLPDNVSAMVRCVLESLALKYRYVLEKLIALTGHRVDVLHIIGGGSQNRLLCQMTADATGRVVLAGPTEATSLGNAVVQLITLGELANIGDARRLIAQSSELARYEPKNTTLWEEAYQRFLTLIP
jgi:rhamnulokinase